MCRKASGYSVVKTLYNHTFLMMELQVTFIFSFILSHNFLIFFHNVTLWLSLLKNAL